MKALSFRGFAQYSYSKQKRWRHSQDNHCRICQVEITDRALYCTSHSRYRKLFNKLMQRWLELEDKLDRGIITLDEAKEIKVWP